MIKNKLTVLQLLCSAIGKSLHLESNWKANPNGKSEEEKTMNVLKRYNENIIKSFYVKHNA